MPRHRAPNTPSSTSSASPRTTATSTITLQNATPPSMNSDVSTAIPKTKTLHPHPPPNQLLRRRPNSSQSTPSLPSLSSDHSTHIDPCFLHLFGVVLPLLLHQVWWRNRIIDILFAYSLAQKLAASVIARLT